MVSGSSLSRDRGELGRPMSTGTRRYLRSASLTLVGADELTGVASRSATDSSAATAILSPSALPPIVVGEREPADAGGALKKTHSPPVAARTTRRNGPGKSAE
jgi:hypothetical protein